MLEIHNCCLVVVDVQGKLAQLMADKETLFRNIQILIQAAKILEIPILWCQQVPEALGPTLPEIAQLLTGTGVEGVPPSNRRQSLPPTRSGDDHDKRVWNPIEPINKASFSCCGEEKFNQGLEKTNARQVLLCGIETHVCVYQTAMDLLARGLEPTVVADAVSSRTAQNRQIALTRLAAEGAKIGSTEMVLFELLQTAQHPQFRQIAKLVK
jgi:nicotinamidase-related amidase